MKSFIKIIILFALILVITVAFKLTSPTNEYIGVTGAAIILIMFGMIISECFGLLGSKLSNLLTRLFRKNKNN